jgi:hypothetical protein
MSAYANFFAEAHRPTNQPWLVPKLLRSASVALIAAAPNSMKTWAGLDLARGIITGGQWMDRPCHQGAVMLVSLDSALGDVSSQFRRLTQSFADQGPEARALLADLIFRYRIQSGFFDLKKHDCVEHLINTANMFSHKTRTWPGGEATDHSKAAILGDDGFHYITIPCDPYPGTDPGTGEPVTIEEETKIDPAHFGVSLILIDSLSTAAPSADQNAAEQMGTVMAHIREIAEKTGALVLVLHHNRKMNPMAKDTDIAAVRGSGVITAAPETVLMFEPANDPTIVEVRVAKQRGDRDRTWRFMLAKTGDPDADNKYGMGVYNEGLDADVRYKWDSTDDGKIVRVEKLYKEARSFARAELLVLKGASPRVEMFLRYLLTIGGVGTLEDATTWALTSGNIAFSSDDPAERAKQAKKWVRNTASDARAAGWIEKATEDAKGVYKVSERTAAQYAPTDIAEFTISESELDRMAEGAAAKVDADDAEDDDVVK